MNLLCDYENYLRDRYILGQPVRYMHGGFGDASSGASASQSKQKIYGPDGNEYTYIDDPTSPNAGRYYRNVGGPGGGRIVFLDEVQEASQKRQMEDANKAAQPQVADNRQSAQRPAQEKPSRRPVKKAWNLTEIEDANGDFLDVQVKASSEDEAKQIVADALKIQRDTRKKVGGGYSWGLQEILEWGERNPEKFKQAVEDAKPQVGQPQTAPKTEPSAPQTEQVDADSGQHGSEKEATSQSNVDYAEFADAYKRYRAEDKKVASLKRKASKIQKAVFAPSSGATPEEVQSARESLAKIRGEISDSEKVKKSLSSGLNSFTKKHNVVFIDGGDSFVVNPSPELIQGLKQRKSLQDSVKKARKKAEEAKKAGLKTNASEIASIADKLEGELNRVNDLLSQMFPNETVVSVVDEKPKRRPANKKKEPQEERAEENAYRNDDEVGATEFKPGDLLFKRNLLDRKTGYGSYRSQPSEYGKANLDALFHALNANDLSYFEDINPADFDNSKKFMVTTRLGDKKEFTARNLFEEIQEESADGDGGFNIYNNADTNNFIDRYKGSKGWPRRFQKIFSETNKEPKLNWQLQLAANTLEDTNYEFARGEFGGDYAPQYLNSVCSLVADLGQSLPPIDADPKIKAGFLNRYLCFLYGSALAAYASDEEGLHRKEADKLAWQFLKAGRGEVTSRLLKKLFNAAEKQGFTSPAIDSPIGINSGVYYRDDFQKKENAPAAQKQEPKDVVARDVKNASGPGVNANADSFVEGVETDGFGLPSSESTSPVVKDGSSNKDAAYFVRRDLEATPKEEVKDEAREAVQVSETSSSKYPKRDDDAALEMKVRESLAQGEPLRKKATRLRSKAKEAALKGRKVEAAELRKQADGIESEARKYIDEATNAGVELKNRRAEASQQPVSETKEPIEKPEVSNSSTPEQQPEPVAETVQEQPAKPRPERWTPLKSKMNDDDKRVVENTRKRLNYGLSELAWRLGNAKEKGDVQRVKQLVATAANHYLEQVRRAYRSHGGTEALAAFDETLGGDGLTVGQLRDRVVDKFRKIAQMEANDLFKFAGERLDEFESFTEADSEPISNKEIHLNSIRDKNGKWEDLDDKDSEVTVEDGKPSTLFPDEHFGRRMGSERGLADAVRRALKSMTRKGEYRDSFENGAEYAVPKYNIDTPTRMGRFLAHGYKDSLDGKPVSRDDYSEQRYQELLKKFPTDRESRKLNDLFNSNNREVNKLIKENEDEYKQSENKSGVVQRVVDGIRDLLSEGRQNGSVEAPPSESLRNGTASEVLETGGTDRLSDGGDGRHYTSIIAEEAKKSDIPESRVREELSSSTDKSSKKTNSFNTSSSEGVSDWERELEETRKLGYLEVPSTTQGRKRNPAPNSAAKKTNISEPSQISSGNSKTEPHASSGQDPLVSEGQNTSGEEAPVAKNRRGRPRIVRPSSTSQASGNSEKIAREVEKFEVPKEQLQKRIAEALGQTAKPETNANPEVGAKQGHKKRFSPDYINEDVEKAIQVRDADRRKLSLESIEYMMWLAQNVSGKYGATGLKNFIKRIDVTPTGTTSRKLLNELREYLEAVSASRYNAMTINKKTGYQR